MSVASSRTKSHGRAGYLTPVKMLCTKTNVKCTWTQVVETEFLIFTEGDYRLQRISGDFREILCSVT